MKKAIKWLLILILFFVLLLVGAFTFINNPIVKNPLINQISQSLGRPIELNGPIHITWGDPWQFALKDVSIKNPVWGSSPHALKMQDFHVNIDTSLLLSGKLAIEEISLIAPQIWIESKDGRSNWEFQQQSDESDNNHQETQNASGYPQWLLLKNILIKDAQIYFYQQGEPKNLSLKRLNFTQNNKTATLAANLAMNAQQFSITGETLALPLIINAARQANLDLRIENKAGDSALLDGTIQFANNLFNLDADVNLEIADLSQFSEIAGVSLPAIKEIKGQARLHNHSQQQNALSVSDISIQSTSRGLNLGINGQVSDLTATKGLDLALQINGQTRAQQILPKLENDFDLSADIDTKVVSNGDDIELQINQAIINSNIANVTIGENSINLQTDWTKPLPIDIRIDNTQRFAQTIGVDLPPVENLRLDASILRQDAELKINSFNIDSSNNHIVVRSSGDLAYADSGWRGTEKLSVEVDAFVLDHWVAGLSDAGLKKLTLTTNLRGQEEILSFEALSIVSNVAAAANEPILSADGNWQDIRNIATLNLDTRIALSSMQSLSTVSQTQLPDVGPLQLTAKIAGDNKDKLNIRDINLSLDNAAAELRIVGHYDDVLSENRDLSLNITSEFRDAGLFDVFLNSENNSENVAKNRNLISLFMPATAALDLAFANQSLRFENIEVQSQANGLNTQIEGQINSSKPWQGQINLVSNGQLNIEQLEQKTEINNLPKLLTGQLDLSANLHAEGDKWGLADINLDIDSEHGKLSAKGSVPSFKPLASEDFILTLKSDDLQNIVGKNTSINENQLVDIILHLHGSKNPTEAQTLDLKAAIGDSDVNGRLNWNAEESKYMINSALKSNSIDLNGLLSKQSKEHENESKATRIFNDSAFNLDWMQRLNINFNWNIKRLIGAILTLKDVDISTSLKNQNMTNSIRANTEKGTLNAKIDLAKQNQTLKLEAKIDGNNIETAALTQFGLEEVLDKSELNFKVDLAGQGVSSQALASSLDGVVMLKMDEAELKNSVLDWVGGDIITGLVSAINPIKRKEEENINLQCASLYVAVKDGLIDEKNFIGLKTDKVTMLGDAKINLADESMELYFIPRANKGLGISASTVAKMVRIGGTFLQPKIETDAEGLLKSGAAVGLAVATGGWTLVAQGLFDRFKSSTDICQQVIKNSVDDKPVTEFKREVVKEVDDKKLIRVQAPDSDESQDNSDENKYVVAEFKQNESDKSSDENSNDDLSAPPDPESER